jgi:hypothetical protein
LASDAKHTGRHGNAFFKAGDHRVYDHRVYVDSAPHFVANADVTLAGYSSAPKR